MDKKKATSQLSKAATATTHNHNTKNNIDASEIRQAAHGRWRSIHASLGLAVPNSHRKHTPCQGCGGKDRFRISEDYDMTGRWLCGGGGDIQSGDGFSLLMHVYAWNFPETLKAVADVLGYGSMSHNDRQDLRLAAEQAQRKIQREIAKRTALANADCYLLDCTMALEDEIKTRQSEKATEHSSGELFRAARLLGAIESNYGGLKQ